MQIPTCQLFSSLHCQQFFKHMSDIRHRPTIIYHTTANLYAIELSSAIVALDFAVQQKMNRHRSSGVILLVRVHIKCSLKIVIFNILCEDWEKWCLERWLGFREVVFLLIIKDWTSALVITYLLVNSTIRDEKVIRYWIDWFFIGCYVICLTNRKSKIGAIIYLFCNLIVQFSIDWIPNIEVIGGPWLKFFGGGCSNHKRYVKIFL